MHNKHGLTQKAEDEQVQPLVEGKKVFSAGGQWATIGMQLQLLGSSTVIQAQTLQLERERKGGQANAANMLMAKIDKLNKVQEALIMYQSNVKMGRWDWDDIIRFLYLRFRSNAVPSKLNSTMKVKAKLVEFEVKYGKNWDVLLYDELTKARAENAVAESEINDDGLNVDLPLTRLLMRMEVKLQPK